MDRILPEYQTVQDAELEEAVFIALGFASVCWEPMDGTGVFEAEKAKQAGEELLGVIRQYAEEYCGG